MSGLNPLSCLGTKDHLQGWLVAEASSATVCCDSNSGDCIGLIWYPFSLYLIRPDSSTYMSRAVSEIHITLHSVIVIPWDYKKAFLWLLLISRHSPSYIPSPARKVGTICQLRAILSCKAFYLVYSYTGGITSVICRCHDSMRETGCNRRINYL